MSKVIAVIHAKHGNGNNINGNARRLFIGLKEDSTFDWVSEDCSGEHSMPKEWLELPRLTISITGDQYRNIRKMKYLEK